MPKAVGVIYRYYCGIRFKLLSLGFREMSRREVRDEIIAHGLKRYKKSTEAEKGYIYTQKGLTVKVWTSCERSKVDDCAMRCKELPLLKDAIGEEVVSRPKSTDMGWVLIVDSRNTAQYFAVPFHRTLNFIVSLCETARITQLRVQGRPQCKECGKYMVIRVEKTRATYWACFQTADHATRKAVFLDWDHALPPKAKAAAMRRRKKRKLWQESKLKLRDEGKKVSQSARTLRHGWKSTMDPYVAT